MTIMHMKLKIDPHLEISSIDVSTNLMRAQWNNVFNPSIYSYQNSSNSFIHFVITNRLLPIIPDIKIQQFIRSSISSIKVFSFIICFMPSRTTHPTNITMALLLWWSELLHTNKSEENLWWFTIDSTTYLQRFCFRWELVGWGFWLNGVSSSTYEIGIYMAWINMCYWLEMYLWFDKYSNLFIWVHVESMGVWCVLFQQRKTLLLFFVAFFKNNTLLWMKCSHSCM